MNEWVISFDGHGYADPYGAARFADIGCASNPDKSVFTYFKTHEQALKHVKDNGGTILHDEVQDLQHNG